MATFIVASADSNASDRKYKSVSMKIHRLPPGFPAYSEGPMVWSGQGRVSYILELDEDDIAEINEALGIFMDLELDCADVKRENFPLPNLKDRLEQCATDVLYGFGLCIIRGLDPEQYSNYENTILFLGLSAYLGDQRGVQTAKGAKLTHVTERKTWSVPREKRHGIHTNQSLPFHADMGVDILSLHVRSLAASGGNTIVASAGAIYNELVENDPQALRELVEPNWPVQTSTNRAMPYVLSPLMEYHQGRLIFSMDPARLGPRMDNTPGSHPSSRASAIPALTPQQQYALKAVQAAAQKHQLTLSNQPGDMMYLNNWGLVHGREIYEDGPLDVNQGTRHLVRLWLRNNSMAWEVPPSMKGPWESAFGTRAARIRGQYPPEPVTEYYQPKYSSGSAAFVPEDNENVDAHGGAGNEAKKDPVTSSAA